MTVLDANRRADVDAWVEKALEDRDVARRLADEPERFAGTIAFHCQQAAEKILRAWLIDADIVFPKTHDIHVLLEVIGNVRRDLAESLREVRILSRYSVGTRYPTDIVSPTATERVRALELTETAVITILGDLRRPVPS